MANWRAIREPFKSGAHKFKVQASTKDKSKSLAVFYIDARDVQDRLDAVVGPENWSDQYEVISVGNPWAVQCTLTVDGVTKQDVGEGKAPKDAYSDALKRAAVKFGLARYLYNSPQVWAESQDSFGGVKFTPAGEQKVKQALATYLNRVGIAAKADELGGQDDDEAEPQHSSDNKPASNGNGHKSQPASDDAKPWASDPLSIIRASTDYQFSGPAEAIGWGNATGVFDDYRHAQNAYEEVKREKSPKSPTEMWAAWIANIAKRLNEKEVA